MSNSGNTFYGFVVNSTGNIYNYHSVSNDYSVRPVLYLKSNVNIVDGTGKSGDKFI